MTPTTQEVFGLFEMPFVGDALPPEWHRATNQLLRYHRAAQARGLAPASAEHLLVSATPFAQVAPELLPQVKQGITQLKRFGWRLHPFGAFGMAYTQLAIAKQTGPVNVFMAKTGITSLWKPSLQAGKLFIDPVVTPIENEGAEADFEACFSCLCLSLQAQVTRWKAVRLASSNQQTLVLRGAAARLVQHENDHNHGILCVDLAFQQGGEVHYVPPEASREFKTYIDRGRTSEWPWPLLQEQWDASRKGEFPPLVK